MDKCKGSGVACIQTVLKTRARQRCNMEYTYMRLLLQEDPATLTMMEMDKPSAVSGIRQREYVAPWPCSLKRWQQEGLLRRTGLLWILLSSPGVPPAALPRYHPWLPTLESYILKPVPFLPLELFSESSFCLLALVFGATSDYQHSFVNHQLFLKSYSAYPVIPLPRPQLHIL